jgi:hypothetical protein
MRRVPSAAAEPVGSANANPRPAGIDGIETRLAHLEQLVEGLQDAVHRDSERKDKLIAELQAQIQPAAMGAALSKDARDRRL